MVHWVQYDDFIPAMIPTKSRYDIVFYHKKFVYYFLLKKGFQMDFNSPLVQSRKYSFCDDAIMHHRGLSELVNLLNSSYKQVATIKQVVCNIQT